MANVNINDLVKNIPLGEIASSFGVDESTAKQAVLQALPGLLGGMAVNASNEDGAKALTGALKKHEGAKLKGLDAVDTKDGEKIVKHVLGDKQDAVAKALGAQAGGGIADLIPKLLPVLAPIVMAYLAQQMSSRNSDSASSGGGIGDLLGGLLGGGGDSGGGSDLGDLLGGLLGGGGNSNSGGGLGGLLGGLLGGK